MNREGTFYADAVRYTANRKGFTDTAVLTADYYAFKYLDTFTIAFNNLYVNFYRISGTECVSARINVLILPQSFDPLQVKSGNSLTFFPRFSISAYARPPRG